MKIKTITKVLKIVNIKNDFNIGEVIENTEAFGNVKIVDIFISITKPEYFCYRVEEVGNPFNSYMCSEEELITDKTHFPPSSMDATKG